MQSSGGFSRAAGPALLPLAAAGSPPRAPSAYRPQPPAPQAALPLASLKSDSPVMRGPRGPPLPPPGPKLPGRPPLPPPPPRRCDLEAYSLPAEGLRIVLKKATIAASTATKKAMMEWIPAGPVWTTWPADRVGEEGSGVTAGCHMLGGAAGGGWAASSRLPLRGMLVRWSPARWCPVRQGAAGVKGLGAPRLLGSLTSTHIRHLLRGCSRGNPPPESELSRPARSGPATLGSEGNKFPLVKVRPRGRSSLSSLERMRARLQHSRSFPIRSTIKLQQRYALIIINSRPVAATSAPLQVRRAAAAGALRALGQRGASWPWHCAMRGCCAAPRPPVALPSSWRRRRQPEPASAAALACSVSAA